MRIKHRVILVVCAVLCQFSVNNGWSQEIETPFVGHAYYGNMAIPNNNSDLESMPVLELTKLRSVSKILQVT
jgi:hypothetical protein